MPGAGFDIGINGTAVSVIGSNRQIYKWNGTGWNTLPYSTPLMERLDVSTNNYARTIGQDGLYYEFQENGAFPKGDFIGIDISVPEDEYRGHLLSPNGIIYKYAGNGLYDLVGGSEATNLTVGINNDIWILKQGNTLQRSMNCSGVEPQCPCSEAHFNFDNSYSASGLYQAIETVTGSNIIPDTEIVDYKAGTFILLEAGFEVELGAEFSAEIEVCN